MKQIYLSYLLIVISLYVLPSYGLYFHISETERKCFIEEIPDDTLVVGKCKAYVVICHVLLGFEIYDDINSIWGRLRTVY